MRFSEEKLYNKFDFTKLRELNAVEMCYKRAIALTDAVIVEVSKAEPDYSLIKAQNDAIKFWRGIATGMLKRPGVST